MLNLCSLFKHSHSISIYMDFFVCFGRIFLLCLTHTHTHFSTHYQFQHFRIKAKLSPFIALLFIIVYQTKAFAFALHLIQFFLSPALLHSVLFFVRSLCHFCLLLFFYFRNNKTGRLNANVSSAHIYFEVTKMAAGPKKS